MSIERYLGEDAPIDIHNLVIKEPEPKEPNLFDFKEELNETMSHWDEIETLLKKYEQGNNMQSWLYLRSSMVILSPERCHNQDSPKAHWEDIQKLLMGNGAIADLLTKIYNARIVFGKNIDETHLKEVIIQKHMLDLDRKIKFYKNRNKRWLNYMHEYLIPFLHLKGLYPQHDFDSVLNDNDKHVLYEVINDTGKLDNRLGTVKLSLPNFFSESKINFAIGDGIRNGWKEYRKQMVEDPFGLHKYTTIAAQMKILSTPGIKLTENGIEIPTHPAFGQDVQLPIERNY